MDDEHAARAARRARRSAVVVVELIGVLPADGPEGVAPAAVSLPEGSLLGSGAPSAVWVPPRLRLRPGGDGLIVAEDRARGRAALHRFAGGAIEEAIVVDARWVVDAFPAYDGTWLLVGPEGVLRRVPGGPAPPGAWERLLGDAAGATYAVVRRPATAVARIDPEGPRRELGPPGLDPVMDADGRLAWRDAGHGWNVLAPDRDAPERTPLPPDADGVPVGLDGDGRAYLAKALTLTCVRPGSGIEWSFGAESLALAPGGGVIAANAVGDELDVTEWRDGAGPERRRLPLPAVPAGRRVAWRLISVTDAGQHVLWGGEGARGSGILAVVEPGGLIEELSDPAPQDARLQGWWPAPAREWQVDAAGRAHLTLAGPEGVALLRITAAA